MLSIPDLRRLFDHLDDFTTVRRRDQVFFQLAYAAGLRLSEVTDLRAQDINWEEGSLRVVGNGDKERRIYLKPGMLERLRHYIREARVEDYLFPGQADRAVTARQMDQRFKEYVRAAKLPVWVTPHVLRHSIAINYLLGGAPLSFVQDLLGHASLATTGIYTRLTDPMTKENALRIPSALDLPPAGPTEKVSREERAAYVAEVEYWDRLVSDVWEWPGEGRG